MRRLLVWTLTAGMVFLAGGHAALAKEGHEDPRSGATGILSPVPKNLEPGQPWNATITFRNLGMDGNPVVAADGFRPTVTLVNVDSGERIGVTAFLERPGIYDARIVFPEAGRWSIMLRNGYDGTTNDVTTLTLGAATVSTSSGRSFSVWAWVTSGVLSLLVVAGGFLLVPRLRRKQSAVAR